MFIFQVTQIVELRGADLQYEKDSSIFQ